MSDDIIDDDMIDENVIRFKPETSADSPSKFKRDWIDSLRRSADLLDETTQRVGARTQVVCGLKRKRSPTLPPRALKETAPNLSNDVAKLKGAP